MEAFLQVGVISSTHGVHGEVKVFPTTDDAKRFEHLKEVILRQNDQDRILHIRSIKYFKQFVILGFNEFHTLNEVEALRGCSLLVERKNAVSLDKDEYYIADLLDIEVIDEQKNLHGKITDVLKTGANDVYQIQLDDGRELLLPAIADCIIQVDIEGRKMVIQILEGLLE